MSLVYRRLAIYAIDQSNYNRRSEMRPTGVVEWPVVAGDSGQLSTFAVARDLVFGRFKRKKVDGYVRGLHIHLGFCCLRCESRDGLEEQLAKAQR